VEREIRVTLLDGSVVEGIFAMHTAAHLSLEDRGEEMVYVPTEEIRTLELGIRRPVRELAVVTGIILGITALLVVESQIPFLRAHLSLPWFATQLAIFTFAGVVHLRKRTALGAWLRSWRPLFDVERPVDMDRIRD
jgi:hypothetical protein